MTNPSPPTQYLATGFRDVDRSGDTTACIRCLDLLSDIPFFRNVKEESFRLIADTTPHRVLDAGCGAGNDLDVLTSILPPETLIAGLDASETLLTTAAKRTAAHRNRCLLIRGDLMDIPCRDETFSSCRIDRVLQHVYDPERVIRELERVTAPGGMIVAFDNDWDTLSIALSNRETSARLTRFWSASFASGRVGKDLAGIFRNAGLTDIHAEPRTLTISGLSLAEKVFDIRMLLDRMSRSGALTLAESVGIWEDLVQRAQRGMFTSGYTGFLAWGTKPE